jgi:hypothetical protein
MKAKQMTSQFIVFLLFCVFSVAPVTAEETQTPDNQTKEMSGMSILGNDEAPKSLYIIPWKSSELGDETSLNMMLNEKDVPIDRDIFLRQLDYFVISKEGY